MSTELARLGLQVDADGFVRADKVMRDFNRTAETTERRARQINHELDATKTGLMSLQRVLVPVIGAIGGIKLSGLVKESAALNSRFEQMGLVMEVVGRNAGFSAAEVNRYAQEVQGMGITMNESRQTVIRMIQAQMDLTQASKLARVAQDAAVIGNINSTEALSRLIHGIQAGQIEVLRGIGINVQFEQGYRQLAETLGKSTDELTDAERAQSRMNQVMDAGSQIAGAYEASMDSAAKQLGSTARYVEDLKVMWGGMFSEANKQIVFGYSDALQSLLGITERLRDEGKLDEWGNNIASALGHADKLAVLLAANVAGRLTPAIWSAAAAKQAAIVQAVRYQAALTGMTGASGAAATAQTALALATRGASAALALVGGATGGLAIAGVGAYYLMDAYTSLDQKTKDLIASTREQNDALETLSKTQIQNAIQANKEYLAQLSIRLAAAQELANTNVQLGITDLRQQKTLNALTAEHKALAEVIGEQIAFLEDLERGVATATEATERLSGATEDARKTAEDLIKKYALQTAQLTMSARAREILNARIEHGNTLSDQELRRVVDSINAYYDQVDALAALADETDDTGDSITKLGRKSSEVSDAMIRDWQNVRQSFGEFFADLVLEGTNAFDALLKSWERTALQMAGNKLFDMGAQLAGISIPGGTGSTSYGAFGSVLSAGAGRFLPGLTRQGAAITDAELQQLMGGKSTGVGGLNLTDLKGIGMNIGAGIAGSFAGTALGEGIFGKQAESHWGASAGGMVGAYLGGPLGSFIGSAIGSAVDVAFGGDGKLRSNAGFLAAPTPGLKSEYNAGKHTFASGLEVNLFARRADASQAREILQVFDQVDRSFVDLVKQLGGSISVSQLTGLDEEANPGSYGAFFGVGGNGTTQGNILAQVNSYIAQLTDHTSGLSDALLETIRSANSAEEVLAELTKAVAMETIQDKLDPLRVKTRAYEQDLELLQRVYAEGSDEYEDAARRLAEIHGLAAAATERLAGMEATLLRHRQAALGNLLDHVADMQSMQRDLQMQIYTLMGAIPLFSGDGSVASQLQYLQDRRRELELTHREEIRAEEELHRERMRAAESLTETIAVLRRGGADGLMHSGAQYQSLMAAARAGDMGAVSSLAGVSQDYLRLLEESATDELSYRRERARVIRDMEELAAQIKPAEAFDPAAANARLVAGLEAIQGELQALLASTGNATLEALARIEAAIDTNNDGLLELTTGALEALRAVDATVGLGSSLGIQALADVIDRIDGAMVLDQHSASLLAMINDSIGFSSAAEVLELQRVLAGIEAGDDLTVGEIRHLITSRSAGDAQAQAKLEAVISALGVTRDLTVGELRTLMIATEAGDAATIARLQQTIDRIGAGDAATIGELQRLIGTTSAGDAQSHARLQTIINSVSLSKDATVGELRQLITATQTGDGVTAARLLQAIDKIGVGDAASIAELKRLITISQSASTLNDTRLAAVLSQLGIGNSSTVGELRHIASQMSFGDNAVIQALSKIHGAVNELPPDMASAMTSSVGAWISGSLQSGIMKQVIADMIPSGSILEDAVNKYLQQAGYKTGSGGQATVDDVKSPVAGLSDAQVRAQLLAIQSQHSTEKAALQAMVAWATGAGVGSGQAARAMGLDQQHLLNKIHGYGIHYYAMGGIADGPLSGYPAILHGTEAVVPLPDGRSIPVDLRGVDMQSGYSDMATEFRQLREEMTSELRSIRAELGDVVLATTTTADSTTKHYRLADRMRREAEEDVA